MADEQQDNVVHLATRLPPPLASGGSGPHDPGNMEARVAKLESDVAHIQADVREIKSVLTRLATVIDRMDGFLNATLPTLATKLELEKRPTHRQIIFDIVAFIGGVGAIVALALRFAH